MANTYTWVVEQMDCYPTDPRPDCVFNVHFRCNAADTTYPTATATYCNIQTIIYNPSEPYIPYDQLTQDIVLAWVFEALGADEVNAIKSALTVLIENILNPPVTTPPLPWN
jgi:hypothetical protein